MHDRTSDLVGKIGDDVDLFHGTDGTPYATVDDGRRTLAIRSRGFEEWVNYFAYRVGHGVVGRIDDVILPLAATARYDGPERNPNVRFAASDDGSILLHLGGNSDAVVRINADGWKVLTDGVSVPFLVPPGQLPLVEPAEDGTLDDVRIALGLESFDVVRLVALILIAIMDPHGPYPILGIQGEAGSGKSTLAAAILSLIDPTVAGLRGDSAKPQELSIATRHCHVLGLDNLTTMPKGLADNLCRLTSGTSAAYRQNYTDDEEVIFTGSHPVIVTGIDVRLFRRRDDVLSRTLLIHLPALSDTQRRTVRDLNRDFEEHRARALGFLLGGLSTMLANRDKLPSLALPRLADTAESAAAAASAVGWTHQEAIEAVNASSALLLETKRDPIAVAITNLVADEWGHWQGTSAELLDEIRSRAPEHAPGSPSALGSHVRKPAVTDDLDENEIVFSEGRRADRRMLAYSYQDDL